VKVDHFCHMEQKSYVELSKAIGKAKRRQEELEEKLEPDQASTLMQDDGNVTFLAAPTTKSSLVCATLILVHDNNNMTVEQSNYPRAHQPCDGMLSFSWSVEWYLCMMSTKLLLLLSCSTIPHFKRTPGVCVTYQENLVSITGCTTLHQAGTNYNELR
jgi:hypothetical protein